MPRIEGQKSCSEGSGKPTSSKQPGPQFQPCCCGAYGKHPLVRGKNFVSLLDIEHWADQEIKTLVKQDRLEKLQEWRRKMRNNMSHAREWVKRDNNLPVTSVHFEGYQENTATSSNQQSLEAISQFLEEYLGKRQATRAGSFSVLAGRQ